MTDIFVCTEYLSGTFVFYFFFSYSNPLLLSPLVFLYSIYFPSSCLPLLLFALIFICYPFISSHLFIIFSFSRTSAHCPQQRWKTQIRRQNPAWGTVGWCQCMYSSMNFLTEFRSNFLLCSFPFSYYFTLFPSIPLSLLLLLLSITNTLILCSCLSPSFSPSLSVCLFLSLSIYLSLTHTHNLSHTHTISLTHTQTHTLSLLLSLYVGMNRVIWQQ